MRKLFYISPLALCLSLLALASCTTQLTGPPEPPQGSASFLGFFWPDSAATYHYQVSTGSVHTLTIKQGGSVVDKNEATDSITNLSISRTGSSYSISGFGSFDLFALGFGNEIVKDTARPGLRMELIRSIAALNPKFGNGTLYAASDSVLYQVNLATNALTRLNPLPALGLTLAEDVSGSGIYAVQFGGRGIYWTYDNGSHWATDSTPAGTAITAFASADPGAGHYSHDLFWVACGPQLYRFAFGASAVSPIGCPINKIVALERDQDPNGSTDGVVAAGDDGSIYFLSQTGAPKLLDQVSGSIGGIAGTYASTPNGIYDVSQTPAKLVLNSNDSAIYSSGVIIFAARSDGSVDHFTGGSQKITNSNLSAPNSGVAVSQFAYPFQGTHDPDKGIYVLSAGQVFYQKDSLSWLRVNQTILPPAQLLPGALTLLTADSTWIAGYLESNYKGIQRGYGYRAKSEGTFPQVRIGTITYNDVLIVSYATESNGVMETQNVPQYTIYFEKGVGPVAFERTWNGTTITTQLLQ